MAEQRQLSFRFLDLCAELRNAIYELLLSSDDSEMDLWVWQGKTCISPTSGQPRPPHGNVGLTRVNRQVHAEATPILYGRGNFIGLTAPSLPAFLKQIGPSICFLRHVTIDHKTAIRPSLNQLKKATHLDRLDVTWYARIVVGDAEEMAKLLGPWFRAFHKMRMDDSRKSAPDVMSFRSRDRGPPELQAQDALAVIEYTARVRAELSKALKE